MRNMKKAIVATAFLASMSAAALAAGPAGIVSPVFIQKGAGAVPLTYADKAAQTINTKDFGAVCNDVVDDTAAMQRAVDATPTGATLHVQAGRCKITAAIRVAKAIRIAGAGRGPYSLATDVNATYAGSLIHQVTAGANAFTLVPQATGNAYRWGYGITDVQFESLNIQGPSTGAYGGSGIGTDKAINQGDYHLRQLSFRDLNVQYFANGIELTGIAYLNNFYQVSVSYSTTGIRIARGAASDLGGQTRFFGITIVATDTALSLNEDTLGGSFAVFGSTLSESKYGIRANEETLLTVQGCEFETLRNSGTGAGIYIPLTEGNPNTQGTKTIVGNKFLSSDADIWIDKKTTAYSGGGFHWPMLIDGNEMLSTLALKVTVPAGHTGIDSPAFVIGAANAGINNGRFADSQISAAFMGTDQRKRKFIRRVKFDKNTPSGATLLSLPDGFVVQTVKTWLTANNSGFTAVKVGTQANDSQYASLDGGAGALNTPTVYQPATGLELDGSKNQVRIVYTAATNSVAGVVEVEGYWQ
jgi:hypothetical protein